MLKYQSLFHLKLIVNHSSGEQEMGQSGKARIRQAPASACETRIFLLFAVRISSFPAAFYMLSLPVILFATSREMEPILSKRMNKKKIGTFHKQTLGVTRM